MDDPASLDTPGESSPLLYTELADWWALLSDPADYAEEAELFRQTLLTASTEPPRSVLELGSGGGNNASHLKAHFEMTLVDRAPGMLAVSRALNPECRHEEGDMRSVRLNQIFDAVFVHDAIMYAVTLSDLRRTIDTAYLHCKPGGMALFVPDCVRETFHARTSHGGHDSPLRSLRYLEWTWDPDPDDTSFVVDFAYLLRNQTGRIRVEHDRHHCGLFARATWLNLLAEAGFQAQVLPCPHSEIEPGMWEMFLCRRPID